MEHRTEIADDILGYLEKIYPKSATESEIVKVLGLQSCSTNPWISTLLANNDIDVVGKKGRANLYKLKR